MRRMIKIKRIPNSHPDEILWENHYELEDKKIKMIIKFFSA